MEAAELQQTISDALALHQAGKYAEAEAAYRQVLETHPDHPDANHLLGVIAYQYGRLKVALELIEKAISINGRVAEYHRNLGLVLAGLGRMDEAADSYRRALELRPNYAKALHNLATVQRMQRKNDQALANCQRALQANPKYTEAWNSLGALLYGRGQLEQAIAAYRRALELNPDYTQALFNLGIALQQTDQMDEAVKCYRRALELKPDYPEALTNLGVVLKLTGQLDEAIVCYRKAFELQPTNVIAHSNYIYLLEFHAGQTQQSIFSEQRAYAKQHAEPLRDQIRPHDNDRNPDRRLRVGYVSPDLRNHVVGSNLLPLMRQHDHAQFEIFCYCSVDNPDTMTKRLRQFADQWRDVAGKTDEEICQAVRDDKIDLLIDLTLHMADNRLMVFARKPAPVQVSYLGYCGGTGLDTIDYRISDTNMDPEESDLSSYSEKTIRLPHSYWCYQPPDPAPRRTDPPCVATGSVTFGCMNNFAKVSAPTLDVWAKILGAAPKSRIKIHALPGSHTIKAMKHFTDAGIAPDRIEFIPRQAFHDYLRCYNRMDIALDPFPYGGGITTCDSLWMGLPVVTLSGNTAVGRGGRSIMVNIGHPEWVARTPEEYLAIAVDLASDPKRLLKLRSDIRDQMAASPLMDAKSFAREVEAAYRQMWKNWCNAT
jgi:protein O-GlcNAc transferase